MFIKLGALLMLDGNEAIIILSLMHFKTTKYLFLEVLPFLK
jgi:hypothetical protein